jgi:hypothetical protein
MKRRPRYSRRVPGTTGEGPVTGFTAAGRTLKPVTSWNPVTLHQPMGMGFGRSPGLGATVLSS